MDETEEYIDELNPELDSVRGELAELGKEWESLADAVDSALSDLAGLIHVPLGSLEESIDDIRRALARAMGENE
jgi:hypothetical protein